MVYAKSHDSLVTVKQIWGDMQLRLCGESYGEWVPSVLGASSPSPHEIPCQEPDREQELLAAGAYLMIAIWSYLINGAQEYVAVHIEKCNFVNLLSLH
jgi:hypothetical protein